MAEGEAARRLRRRGARRRAGRTRDRIDAKVRTPSGGMVRRVNIAQAIVNDPDLLLVDEPTAGLDPEQRVDFRALLRDLGLHATVIVSTHLVEDVAAACTQVTRIGAGWRRAPCSAPPPARAPRPAPPPTPAP